MLRCEALWTELSRCLKRVFKCEPKKSQTPAEAQRMSGDCTAAGTVQIPIRSESMQVQRNLLQSLMQAELRVCLYIRLAYHILKGKVKVGQIVSSGCSCGSPMSHAFIFHGRVNRCKVDDTRL